MIHHGCRTRPSAPNSRNAPGRCAATVGAPSRISHAVIIVTGRPHQNAAAIVWLRMVTAPPIA